MQSRGQNLSSIKNRLRLMVFCLSATLLFAFYHELILHPASFIFDTRGDGLNTWFVMKFYLLDKEAPFTAFRGMNYPFQESIFHFDVQPALLFTFRFINNNVTDMSIHFSAVIFILVMLSLLFTSLCILEILFEYGMISWLCIPFSVGIGLMSPQLHRIFAHIGLSYCIVLPLVWMLYLKYLRHNKFTILILLQIFLVFSGLLHPYYMGLSMILIGLLIFTKSRKSCLGKFFLFLFLMIIPVIVYFIIIRSAFEGDGDIDKLPYGAFGQAYRSRPEDVFTPNLSSHWQEWLNLRWIAHASWEGEAFIGFAMVIPGIACLIYFLFGLFRTSIRRKINPLKTYSGLFLYPMLLFIFTAGALHFILPAYVKVLFPDFITQFRAYGRIAWVIFYMLSIFISIRFYVWYRMNRMKGNVSFAGVVACLFFLLFAVDVAENNIRVAEEMKTKRIELLKPADQFVAKNIVPSHYQAIIAVPYFHKISRNPASREPLDGIMRTAFRLALETGLPLTNMNASRTSENIAALQTGFFTSGDKTSILKYHSGKPVLLITTVEGKNAIEEGTVSKAELYRLEGKLFEKARFLEKSGEFLLFEIAYKELLLMQ